MDARRAVVLELNANFFSSYTCPSTSSSLKLAGIFRQTRLTRANIFKTLELLFDDLLKLILFWEID